MSTSIDRALQLLQTAGRDVTRKKAIIGLDGFVDYIIRVVGQRDSDGTRHFIPSIAALATRLGNAAGKSTAMELIVQRTKLGGNGPIMAGALAAFGVKTTYVGAVGQGEGGGLHPIFEPLRKGGDVYPVVPSAATQALEFDDGKIMLQQMECLDRLDYQALVAHLGEDALIRLFDEADFIALNHWASLRHMTAIWRELQKHVCPRLAPKTRRIFFDLADLEKRSSGDVRDALETIAGFNPWFETNLGLNEKESEDAGKALGLEPGAADPRGRVQARAQAIQEKTGIGSVAVHPTAFAAAATAKGAKLVEGPYVARPKISTGAGDHFNAGYCLGVLLGGDIEQSLQLGVATSGYYVRTAESPSVEKLAGFLRELQAAK